MNWGVIHAGELGSDFCYGGGHLLSNCLWCLVHINNSWVEQEMFADHKKPEFLPFIINVFFLNNKGHSNLFFHAFLL